MNDKLAKILLLGGNNIDKKQMLEVQRRINHDKDIKRLIRYGKYNYRLLLVILIFSIFFYFNIIDFIKTIKTFQPFDLSLNFALLGTIALLSWEIANIKHMIRDTSKEVFNIFTYLRYTWSGKAPKTPADLWFMINSSISDTQAIVPALRKFNDRVSFSYTGEPYFKVRPIDSITIQLKISWSNFIRIYFNYRKLFKEYSIETLTSHAEGAKFLLLERKLISSLSVFGILFASKFFKILLKDKFSLINMEINPKLSEEETRFAKEFIELCTSPQKLSWGLNEQKTPNLKEILNLSITEITFLDDGKRNHWIRDWSQQLKNIFSKRIKIPVKKFIAVPTCHFQKKLKDHWVICLGGAEQHLGLVHLVNKHRWENNKSQIIGIAENEFDDIRQTRFQIGTESLVYGINRILSGREINQSSQTKAEIFSFPSSDTHVISIYGYSAPLTKMATLFFLEKLREGKEEYWPWKREEVKNIITYELELKKGETLFQSQALNEWDENDIMNEMDTDFFEKHKIRIH